MTAQTVSVIIPTHNRANVLGRAIDSVLAQHLPPNEIIVVDDGSTDDTQNLVAAYHQTHPHIRAILQPVNRGAPIARNTGAASARGDLLAFLDSDDAWHPHKLARQVALLAQYPDSPAAFTGFRFVHRGRIARIGTPPAVVRAVDLYPRNVLGGTSSALVRRRAFDEVGGFLPDMPSCQDWELWLRLARLGPLVALPGALVDYHRDADGRITLNRTAMESGHARLFGIISEAIGSPAQRRRVEARHALRMAEILGRHYRQPGAAVGKIGTALRLDPRPITVCRSVRTLAGIALSSL